MTAFDSNQLWFDLCKAVSQVEDIREAVRENVYIHTMDELTTPEQKFVYEVMSTEIYDDMLAQVSCNSIVPNWFAYTCDTMKAFQKHYPELYYMIEVIRFG